MPKALSKQFTQSIGNGGRERGMEREKERGRGREGEREREGREEKERERERERLTKTGSLIKKMGVLFPTRSQLPCSV